MPITPGRDLLADPHGAQLGGGAGADGGRQSVTGDDRGADGALISPAENPVDASTPMLPSDAKPWIAMTIRRTVSERDDRRGAADDGHRPGAHADLATSRTVSRR